MDYERAAITPSVTRHALGFKVVKRLDANSDGVQLTHLPNEILTHVLSHLHPDSHAAVALVSRRFYALVTTPHAWRMAFLRQFPGHESLAGKSDKSRGDLWDEETSDLVRSEVRYFGRLTPLATWRSEYLLRTRLLRGLARGKPGSGSGGVGSSVRNSKKASAVLTYNSKLPWAVTSLHAVFANGKKPPRAVHGAADLGVCTMSDPVVGKVEKWGFEEPFSAQQLDEVFPDLQYWGVGEGPAAAPNVMDVSTAYGMLSGEGFPGGRPYYRPSTDLRGRYLGSDAGVFDNYPDIPKIPELSEAISAVWLAKSSAVPSLTQSMVGILTGSTLGVVTAYAVGWDTSGSRFSAGDMTARWAICPGVPITSIKVDDQYSPRRKISKRVLAVALNALGEVYYLCDVPRAAADPGKSEDTAKNAWHAGRTACWHLVESTRRRPKADEVDKASSVGTSPHRSPCDAMNLSEDELVANARETDRLLRLKPYHFNHVCEAWDMQRRLEVDFAGDDGQGAGETIIVIERGWDQGQGPQVLRYTRSGPAIGSANPSASPYAQTPEPTLPASSIFGFAESKADMALAVPLETAGESTPTSQIAQTPLAIDEISQLSDWHVSHLVLGKYAKHEITSCALEDSVLAAMTFAEDPLKRSDSKAGSRTDTPVDTRPTPETTAEIPGRRSRMLALGTKTGAVLLWNVRDAGPSADINPVRIVQTDSPEVSCLALNGLYLVHGGNDGLVQAWDPLASVMEPVRTLNAKPSGRIPRHMLAMNPGLPQADYSAARTIFLDPDPTILRGVVAFGSFLRYWSYSATSLPPGRKRRLRHSDVHGRLASRREGGKVSGYIAAETAELRLEQEHRERERARLQSRFGVGAFGDMSEEEALHYAQMISEEAYQQDEQRRTSASDTGSAAEGSFDTASSFSENTVSTLTPEPSVSGSGRLFPDPQEEEESEYEMQVQQALRLSLLEGVNEHGQSPPEHGSGDYSVPITFKAKQAKKTRRSPSSSPPAHSQPRYQADGPSNDNQGSSQTQEDLDLALALSLSMEDQRRPESPVNGIFPVEPQEEFPALEVRGKGKGKQL
ncbi:F-box and WD domain-containing protein [Plectosphaerella plurivora]|uniref:F-box and WD domain-containing protein n=1 Tax=Plectosphaerella plurivora TaxID=936078 RepID=A0A9P8VD54_9PEZI|nr:F-box and WD domain-containing protein [Plectosphaerella plurivora]